MLGTRAGTGYRAAAEPEGSRRRGRGSGAETCSWQGMRRTGLERDGVHKDIREGEARPGGRQALLWGCLAAAGRRLRDRGAGAGGAESQWP